MAGRDAHSPELDLMKQFDVSRNTLREAIRALVHAGLLQTRQGAVRMSAHPVFSARHFTAILKIKFA